MRRRFEAALHVGLELAHERRMGQLIRKHRRDAERDWCSDVLALERLQRFDQGEIAVQRSLAQPHAAVRPAAVVQYVREVTVQRENEIHRRRGGRGRGGLSDGRSRLVHSCWSWTVSAAFALPSRGGPFPPRGWRRLGGTPDRALRWGGDPGRLSPLGATSELCTTY